jgi:hypothetical protein
MKIRAKTARMITIGVTSLAAAPPAVIWSRSGVFINV